MDQVVSSKQKRLLTRDGVMDVLSDYDGVDFDTKKYDFRDDGGIIKYGDYLVGNEEVLELAARKAGIPVGFIKKCSTDLQVQVLNEFFSGLAKSNNRPQLVTKERKIQTFVDEGARFTDPNMVLDTIEKTVELEGYDRLYKQNGIVHLYAITKNEQSVEVGDICRGGAFIEFSPYGEINPFVAGYVFRLQCSNGAISTEQLVKYQHRGTMELGSWFENVLPNAVNAVEIEVQKYRKLKEVSVNGDAVDLAKHFMPKGLSRDMREEIIAEVGRRHPTNMYELMNVFTWFGSHHVDDPMQAYRLMYTGGEMNDGHEFCPKCHNLIN